MSNSARFHMTLPSVERNRWRDVADERFNGNLTRLVKTAVRQYLDGPVDETEPLVMRKAFLVFEKRYEVGDVLPQEVFDRLPPRNQAAMKSMNFVVSPNSKQCPPQYHQRNGN